MSIVNLDRFLRDLDRFSRAVPEQATLIQRRISLDALRRLVLKTPVDTGRARGGWQTGIGVSPTGQTRTLDRGGGSTILKGAQVLKDLPPFQVVYLRNNVVYIGALEEGHSQQAPQGMVAVTLEELRAQFQ